MSYSWKLSNKLDLSRINKGNFLKRESCSRTLWMWMSSFSSLCSSKRFLHAFYSPQNLRIFVCTYTEELEQRTAAEMPHKSVLYKSIITGRPARSAAMPVLFLLSGPKMGYSRHVAPINVKFGTGEWIPGSLLHTKFHVYRGKNVGIQPPKLSKFGILARNL